MGLAYENLDETTRQHMLREFDHDVAEESVYLSKWFSSHGKQEYPLLCRETLASGSDDDLADSLSVPGFFATQYQKKTPSGGTTTAAVPISAPIMFAEGEFNRYYLRGLCARVIADGGDAVEIYRARQSSNPRPESEALVGSRVDAATLLTDLRQNLGVETALGLPRPNSGLSGRIAP